VPASQKAILETCSAGISLGRKVGEPTHGLRGSWTVSGWWFGTFFISPYIGNNHSN